MELKRALEIFEYNKAMLTCDMSISRDPEHQDVSPDYYGKDAEELYNAIVCVEKYIKNAIPVEWIEKYLEPYKEHFNKLSDKSKEISGAGWVVDVLETMFREWGKENEINR